MKDENNYLLFDQLLESGVGIIWNHWSLSPDSDSQHHCHGNHVSERDTPTHHLIQHHTKPIHVGRETIALTVEHLRSCPMYSSNIA